MAETVTEKSRSTIHFTDRAEEKTKKKDPNRKGAFIKPEPVVKPEEPEDGIRNIILPEKMTIKSWLIS